MNRTEDERQIQSELIVGTNIKDSRYMHITLPLTQTNVSLPGISQLSPRTKAHHSASTPASCNAHNTNAHN